MGNDDALRHVACNLCGADRPRRLFEKHGATVVRCEVCGLAYVTPRPAPETIAGLYRTERYYRNRHASAYGYGDYLSERDILGLQFRERMDRIEALRPGRGRMLDVGCATGVLLECAGARGWEAQGVDISDFAVSLCRERGLSVHHGDLQSARFPAGHFDVAVLDDTIEHFADPHGELEELRRVLAPGGLLTLNTPNEAGALRRLMGRSWVHYKPPEHLYYFNPDTLRGLLTRAGFRVLGTHRSGKVVTVRYLCHRLGAYSHGLATALLATVGRVPVAERPFFLPIGEFVIFAERV